jgi:hypothetical protein
MQRALRERVGAAHEGLAVAEARRLGAVLASHDDTDRRHVEESAARGARVAEFPTTLEAARACREHGHRGDDGGAQPDPGGLAFGERGGRELAGRGFSTWCRRTTCPRRCWPRPSPCSAVVIVYLALAMFLRYLSPFFPLFNPNSSLHYSFSLSSLLLYFSSFFHLIISFFISLLPLFLNLFKLIIHSYSYYFPSTLLSLPFSFFSYLYPSLPHPFFPHFSHIHQPSHHYPFLSQTYLLH